MPRVEFKHGAVYRMENLAKIHPERSAVEGTFARFAADADLLVSSEQTEHADRPTHRRNAR
jgi:hypothetical protein